MVNDADALAKEGRSALQRRLFQAIQDDSTPLRALPFWRRLVVVGAVPVLVLGTVLVIRTIDADGPDIESAAKVTVEKRNGEVAFTVHNGGRGHRVYRSNVPDRFDRRDALRAQNGQFVDRTSDGSDIVFYRID